MNVNFGKIILVWELVIALVLPSGLTNVYVYGNVPPTTVIWIEPSVLEHVEFRALTETLEMPCGVSKVVPAFRVQNPASVTKKLYWPAVKLLIVYCWEYDIKTSPVDAE